MIARSLAALLVVSFVAAGCEKEKPTPSVSELAKEAEEKDAKLKKEREEVLAKDEAERKKLEPRIQEKRRALEKPMSAIWANLPPDPKKLKQRIDCPDAKISADTPDPAKRGVVLFNADSIYRLTGKTGGAAYHTIAGDDALTMLRPDAPETRVVENKPPETAEQAKAMVDALDWVAAHRYVGVGVFSGFRPARISGGATTPAHVDGWTVIFDAETGKPLCQVEASGENLGSKAETLTVGRQIDEDLWDMYVVTSGKNLEAISKVLWVEGAPKKK